MGTIADLNELAAANLAIDDLLLVRDISDATDKDKKIKAGKMAWKDSAAITAGRVARWKDANSLEDAGFLATDVARLSVANTFALAQTFTAGLKLAGGADTLGVYDVEPAFAPILQIGGNVTGISYATQLGSYTIIGNRLYWQIYLVLSSKGALAGAVTIAGFPQPSLVTASYDFRWETTATSYVKVVGTLAAGSTAISLRGYAAAATASATISGTDLTNTTTLIANGQYAF